MLGHGAGIGYMGPGPRIGPIDNFSLVTGSGLTLPTGGLVGHGRVGGRYCKAGQYGYVPLGQHLV